jgi:hypothetical protein
LFVRLSRVGRATHFSLGKWAKRFTLIRLAACLPYGFDKNNLGDKDGRPVKVAETKMLGIFIPKPCGLALLGD